MPGLPDIEDLDRRLARHEAFWRREAPGRPLLAVTAPLPGARPRPQARDTQESLAGPEFRLALAEHALRATWFGGDALPTAFVEGNLVYPCWGGRGRYDHGTCWVEPDIAGLDSLARYRFDRDNPWARQFIDLHRSLAETARGRCFIMTQGIIGAMDALLLVRGPELLAELALPEAEAVVRTAQQEALRGFAWLVDETWRAAEAAQRGTVTWPGIWAPGRINYWSADLCCMLGPAQVDRWLLPEQRFMVDLCPFNCFHLDGPDAVRHLERFAAVPGLMAIQYTPTPQQPLDEILSVARRIQDLGKATWLWLNTDGARRALKELDWRGLFLYVNCGSVEEGEALLREIR